MTTKTKGRNGWHRATPKTSDNRNHTPAASCIKTLIVRLALWGLLPVVLADWLIQRGGLRDA
ncbi:MAG: hypothetical protein M0P95_12975 [Sulfuritalea sp.]|jgi:hypothetical protein|nr:hypothetical protein [Sulfuritalea sp.]